MSSISIQNRDGEQIKTLPDWERLASPKSATQWKPDHSALELARSWLAGQGPEKLTEVLEAADGLGGFTIESAEAEAQTAFDAYGGPRNHDLLVRGEAEQGKVVVGVEGKASETYGQKIGGYAKAAAAKEADDQPTNAPARLREVTEAITWTAFEPGDGRDDLRYQLFSGIAGTLAAARQAPQAGVAVFFVQQFLTDAVDEGARERNTKDLDQFMDEVFGEAEKRPAGDGWVAGPFHIRAGTERLSEAIPLYIAKAEMGSAQHDESGS